MYKILACWYIIVKDGNKRDTNLLKSYEELTVKELTS
jgi:hypothetical protein